MENVILYLHYINAEESMKLIEESERCLKCKIPQCSKHCPVLTPIPQVMTLFSEGKLAEAGKILFENNPLSAISSIVCPHESNCFGHCVLGKKDRGIEFYEIEEYISGYYLDTVKLTPPPSNGIRVAVVGAGPAGITMSIYLALKGFNVTLIEAKERIGGVLRFGIPDFRLPNEIIDKYSVILRDLGVKFKPNTFIGSTVSLDDMFIDGYKAIFLAVGTAKPKKLGLLGETLGNVHYAINYLHSPDSYNLGKNVVVIGAGNVAIDAARMAKRKSPSSTVTLVNNRDADSMTGNKHEIEMARIDGVRFRHLLSSIRLTEQNVLCVEVEMTVDENGVKQFEERMDLRETLPADTIIVAIGQGPQAAVLSNSTVERNDCGLVSVDENGKTNRPGVFAAGDIVTGPRTVIEAVAFTKKVAEEIENYCLNNK